METIRNENGLTSAGLELDNSLNICNVDRSGKGWLIEEVRALKNLAVNGVSIDELQIAIPSRTAGAISRKAIGYGFGTKEVKGTKVLHDKIARRDKVDNTTTPHSPESTVSDISSINSTRSISDSRISNNNMNRDAINKALDIFIENDMDIDIDCIGIVAKQILKGASNGN